MSLKEDMHTVLMAIAPTAPPTKSEFFAGKATTNISFFEYNEQPESAADDDEASIGHYYQVDLWRKPEDTSTTTMDDLYKQIKSVLKAIGFGNFTKQDLYENDTGTSHYAIRCYYFEEV